VSTSVTTLSPIIIFVLLGLGLVGTTRAIDDGDTTPKGCRAAVVLNSRLNELLLRYSNAHPDVVRTREQLEKAVPSCKAALGDLTPQELAKRLDKLLPPQLHEPVVTPKRCKPKLDRDGQSVTSCDDVVQVHPFGVRES
jgi:hypothetical protein